MADKELNLFDPVHVDLDGNNLVEASAGTGKTYNITALYIRLIIEKNLSPEEILVVTFTKAATRELRERIGKRIAEAITAFQKVDDPGEDEFLNRLIQNNSDPKVRAEAIEKLRKTQESIDRAAIYTIHSFCQVAMTEYVFESGSMFDAQFEQNDNETLTLAADDYWRKLMNRISSEPGKYAVLNELMLGDWKTPDEMRDKCVLQVQGKPYLEFELDPGDLEKKLGEWNTLFEEAKAVYDKDEIQKCLDSSDLDGRRARKKSLETNLFELYKIFEVTRKTLEMGIANNIGDKLRYSYLVERLKDNGVLTTHPIFEILDQIAQLSQELREVIYIKTAVDCRDLAQTMKAQSRIRDYDDILIDMNTALTDHEDFQEAVRSAYPAALIDEFQDTDPIQMEIFKSLYVDSEKQNHVLFLIGDPKQSIYKFRGADVRSYVRMRSVIPGKNRFTLAKNYRTVPQLVESVNKLFLWRNPEGMWDDNIRFNESSASEKNERLDLPESFGNAPMQLMLTESGEPLSKADCAAAATQMTVNEIYRLLSEEVFITKTDTSGAEHKERLRQGDIAVLVLSHQQGGEMQAALSRRGIRSVRRSDESVFKSEEFDWMLHLLRVMMEPSSIPLAKGLFFSNMCGFSVSDFLRLDEEENGWIDLIFGLQQVHRKFEDSGFFPAFRAFMNFRFELENREPYTPEEFILSGMFGERSLTNLYHLAELLNDYQRESGSSMEGLIKWMELQKESKTGSEAFEHRLESDEDLVQIVTMHSSKGLEYPVVFCSFMWALATSDKIGKPPLTYHTDSDSIGVDFTGVSDQSKLAARQSAMAEAVRLFYVGITRAMHRCYTAFLPYETNRSKPLKLNPYTWLFFGPATAARACNDDYTLSTTDYIAAAHAFCTEYKDQAQILQGTDIPSTEILISRDEDVPVQNRVFSETERLRMGWRFTSYSGLKRGHEVTETVFRDDEVYEDDELEEDPAEAGAKIPAEISQFPRGAGPGEFLHQVMEEIKFSNWQSQIKEVILQKMEEHQIDSEQEPAVEKIIRSVLQTPVGVGSTKIRLEDLPEDKLLKEPEFYFHLNQADYENIEAIISKTGKLSGSANFEGFMTGFIDLLFEYDGKYYILDYKSDYLGDHRENYAPDKLTEKMEQRGYTMQYHIYTVALMRYLRNRINHFDYDKHIGGSIYLFMRGLGDGNYGVYFDHPEKALIEKLDHYFDGRP